MPADGFLGRVGVHEKGHRRARGIDGLRGNYLMRQLRLIVAQLIALFPPPRYVLNITNVV